MKSLLQLDLNDTPSAFEQAVVSFVHYYNDCRYHEVLDNVTPADMVLDAVSRRETIK